MNPLPKRIVRAAVLLALPLGHALLADRAIEIFAVASWWDMSGYGRSLEEPPTGLMLKYSLLRILDENPLILIVPAFVAGALLVVWDARRGRPAPRPSPVPLAK